MLRTTNINQNKKRQMKKLFFMALAGMVMAFTSCGNKTAENAEVVDSVATDSVMDAESLVLTLTTQQPSLLYHSRLSRLLLT